MDKVKFGRNGMRGLPPGFRFQPTEEELVFEYLKCKVLSSALPACIIPEINLCNFDPWDLPGGDWEKERFLFSSKESGKCGSGNRIRWSTPSGFWKATGSDRKILSNSSSCSSFVGIKKTLVFYTNTNTNTKRRTRTGWMMHEYRLISTQQTQKQTSFLNNNNNNNITMDEWVLCRIFWKKLVTKNLQFQSPNHNDFSGLNGNALSDSVSSTASSSSSTCSSFFTEFTSPAAAATTATTPLHRQTTPISNSDDDFSAS